MVDKTVIVKSQEDIDSLDIDSDKSYNIIIVENNNFLFKGLSNNEKVRFKSSSCSGVSLIFYDCEFEELEVSNTSSVRLIECDLNGEYDKGSAPLSFNKCDNVNVKGVNVTNEDEDVSGHDLNFHPSGGILLSGVNNAVLDWCNVSGFVVGLHFSKSDVSIKNVRVTTCGSAIFANSATMSFEEFSVGRDVESVITKTSDLSSCEIENVEASSAITRFLIERV